MFIMLINVIHVAPTETQLQRLLRVKNEELKAKGAKRTLVNIRVEI